MKTIDQVIQTVSRPERILQYGEGNFLRGFADWQIDILNEKTGFNGNVAAVQPRNREGAQGAQINTQRGLYTTVLRGLEGGKKVEERRVIRSLSRCINPYTQFDEYFACAENPDLRFVFSNTTEAGISYHEGEKLPDRPQLSFPGKLAAFLHRRYERFQGDPSKALVIIPCELIDRNGDTLRHIVERHAAAWKLGEDFTRWLGACVFCNTLVDRIISGFPAGEEEALWEKLGYQDKLLTAGELFYLWVIEKPKTAPGAPPWDYRREFPLEEAGLNVVWTSNLEFYRTRKVRILNGAHSSIALAASLYGLDTVDQCMTDPVLHKFTRRAIFDEVIPSIELDTRADDGTGVEALTRFAHETLERFANPFIKHQLLSISLNGVSKFKTRVLPSILSYQQKYGRAPKALCCSLAALIVFYRGRNIADGEMEGRRTKNGENSPYPIRDDGEILRYFADLWAAFDKAPNPQPALSTPAALEPPMIQELVHKALSRRELWGEDLSVYPALEEAVRGALEIILKDGVGAALEQAAEEPATSTGPRK